MKFVWALSVLAATPSAARFSLPIYKEKNGVPTSLNFFQRRGVESEIVLGRPVEKSDEGEDGSKARGVPIVRGSWLYTTNISIGTPPQPFRAIIDLNWSDLFVPSIGCRGDHCKSFATYNSSASSTWIENGALTDIMYGPVMAYGSVSTDTLSLGSDLQLPKFDFLELNYYEDVWPDDELNWFDGVLGLGIDFHRNTGRSHPVNLPGPFRHMVDEEMLDKNMFSIVWPRNDINPGSLTFGGYDEEKIDGGLVRHPLICDNFTDWKIAVDQLYVNKNNNAVAMGMVKDSSWPEWNAMMMSSTPQIGLPDTLARAFLQEIDWRGSICLGGSPVVDCDRISELPDLIIGLKGQNLTLKGEDYIERITPPNYYCHDAPDECLIIVTPLPNYDDFPPNLMIFGTSFLKTIYGVFDWDQKSISFGKLKD